MRPLLAILLIAALTLCTSAQLSPLEIPGGALSPAAIGGDGSPLPGEAQSRQGFELAYSVLIENRSGGIIRVIEPPAQLLFSRPGDDIGLVTRPASRFGSAVEDGPDLSVSYSALDELRLRLDGSRELSLLPAGAGGEDSLRGQALLAENAIGTSIAPGRGIFGGRYPLTVGSPLYLFRNGRRIALSPGENKLETGDIFIIEVAVPSVWPRELVVENSDGGSAKMLTADGAIDELGPVKQPLPFETASSAAGASARPGLVACGSAAANLLFSRGAHPVELELLLSGSAGLARGTSLAAPQGAGPARGSAPAEDGFIADDPVMAAALGDISAPVYSAAEAPLGAFIYPSSGLEPPAVMPAIELMVQWKGSTAWLPPPLTLGPADMKNISAFKLYWRGADEPAVPAEAATRQPEVAPADTPSLRGR